MIKVDELHDQSSCLNRAAPEEMVFTLLARDECAAPAIRFWAQMRIHRGKNRPDDKQITEALECANLMDDQRLSGNYVRKPFLDLRDRT